MALIASRNVALCAVTYLTNSEGMHETDVVQ